MSTHTRHLQSGFTLIEMAVALLIVVLLLGSLLGPLSTQVESRKIAEAQRGLDQINEALVGFALAQTPPRLPCPDTNNDGVEDPVGGGCTLAGLEGNVPWVTLGIPGIDPWGSFYRYRVTQAFAQVGGFNLTTAGTISVCTTNTCNPASTVLTNSAPAVVLSHGPNGRGAINAATLIANPAPTAADETENSDADTILVSRTKSESGSVAGEFDDLVQYVSVNVLRSRLVSAQKLP